MKKILGTFTVLLLVVGVAYQAYASWNIRQNDDGTAAWVNRDGDAYPIGRTYLTVNLENLGTASTAYVSVPFAGSIFQVDSVVHGLVTTTTETLTVSIMSQVSPGRDFIKITTNDTITVASNIQDHTGRNSLGGAGDRDTSGEMAGRSTDWSDANEQTSGPPNVPAGGTIAISTAGDSGADVDATIIIYYDRDQSNAVFRD
jgi:hypothetical protein